MPMPIYEALLQLGNIQLSPLFLGQSALVVGVSVEEEKKKKKKSQHQHIWVIESNGMQPQEQSEELVQWEVDE